MVILTQNHSRPLKPHTYNICNIGTDLRKSSSVQTQMQLFARLILDLEINCPSSTVCE